MDATGTNQQELAKVLGISNSHLCNLLGGHRRPSGALALRIARLTNVPIETLIEAEKTA